MFSFCQNTSAKCERAFATLARELEKAVTESVEKPAKNLNNNVSVPPTVAVSTPQPVKEQLQLKRDKKKDVID